MSTADDVPDTVRLVTRTWHIDPTWRLDRIIARYRAALDLFVSDDERPIASPPEWQIHHTGSRVLLTGTIRIGPGFARISPRSLRPHGTHAAFTRHRNNGETPCELCVEGERLYQRQRKRVRRLARPQVPTDPSTDEAPDGDPSRDSGESARAASERAS